MNTLLVVEDEKLIRQGIVAMIRRSSVPVEEILECRNGEEALEILGKQRVDVMFTDIRMPKMDGLELAEKLSEKGFCRELLAEVKNDNIASQKVFQKLGYEEQREDYGFSYRRAIGQNADGK